MTSEIIPKGDPGLETHDGNIGKVAKRQSPSTHSREWRCVIAKAAATSRLLMYGHLRQSRTASVANNLTAAR
jgi:hypothetical protein